MAAFGEHFEIVHVVAEGRAFLFCEAEFFADKAKGLSFVGIFQGDIQPVAARLNDAQVMQSIRKNFHAVCFGAEPVVNGDLADAFRVCDVAEGTFGVGNVGSGHVSEKGLTVRLVVSAIGGAEQGVRVRDVGDGAEGAQDIFFGQAFAAEQFSAVRDDGSVFCHNEDLVCDGCKHFGERGELSSACGAKEDAVFVQACDRLESTFGQCSVFVEQSSVEIAGDKFDHGQFRIRMNLFINAKNFAGISSFSDALHERCEHAQDGAVEQAVQAVFDFRFANLVAYAAGSLEILAKFAADATVEEEDIAFEVHIKTSEIHIRGADDAIFVVVDDAFGMDESRGVAVDFDAFEHQLRIEGLGDGEDIFFVGDMWHDDADVHARAGGSDQSALHFPVEDQVRGIDIDIFFCVVDKFQVQIFADVAVLSERGVAERDAAAVAGGAIGDVAFEVFFFAAQSPKLQKHGGEILNDAAFDEDAGIFPVAERMGFVDILVGDVDAARESAFAVDDGDFAVRAVILGDVEHGAEGVEAHTFDAAFFKVFGVAGGHFEHRTDVVVDESDVHAAGGFVLEDFEDGI